ncbi:MAG: histone deacetylase [Crocinitomix sp. MedPE-SWsnd]|nr:MAG: histone deacetylase [Crocinitomix sp. MedPE-SWsnd]
MRVAFSPIYRYQYLPKEHRFPMDKYELLPQQLLLEGTLSEKDFFEPVALSEAQILRTHSKTYWEKLRDGTLSRQEIRAMGFPYHPTLIERGRHISQGTLQCFYHAKEDGVALNIAGGTHHSYRDRGEGFCLFNDFAIASNELLHTNEVKQIMIVDLDVHQGNGTASIFQKDERVFTFSMHGANNYPLKKEASDLDIGVPDGCDDDTYLNILYDTLPALLNKVQPEVVFYLSGVDILNTDKLGRLGMTKAGCKKRDEFVFQTCNQKGIPVVVAMGGGYSVQIADIIEAHANTFRVAKHIFD